MTLALAFLAGAIWGGFVWHGITEPVCETGADRFEVCSFHDEAQ